MVLEALEAYTVGVSRARVGDFGGALYAGGRADALTDVVRPIATETQLAILHAGHIALRDSIQELQWHRDLVRLVGADNTPWVQD
jgi:hypothetical protein